MKSIAFFCWAVLIAGCTQNEELKSITKEQTTQSKLEEWVEMETFHNVMAETFHPMEDGDLKPILSRSQELADKAKQWQSSKPPIRYQPVADSVNFYLSKLVSESQLLADAISKKTKEDDIKIQLTSLHDRFHSISYFCYSIDKELKKKMRGE